MPTSSLVDDLSGPAARRPLTGREYLRVSLDRSGYARSTGEQHDDNVRDAAAEGVRLGEPYRDDSRSASRYATKTRDDYERLMRDLRSGSFGADVLWLWESSRGSRKVGEWVELIEELERHEILIRVTTHSRYYDPRNPRDRRSLLEDAVDSEWESAKVSLRTRRTAASEAMSGKPHGRVAYGYVRLYDERTGAYAGQEPHPGEAPVVRELFARLRRGHSLRAIAADFEGRGIEKRSGGPFTAQHLRSFALNATYAGVRTHRPGNKQDRARSEGARTQGDWTPIIPLPMFDQVQKRLKDPARRTARPGRGKHLLSMIARCAECGGVLTASGRDGGLRRYICHLHGCVKVDAAELDGIAKSAIIGYLSRVDVYQSLKQGADSSDGERAELRVKITDLNDRLEELADAVASGAVSIELAARVEPQIRKELTALERRERDLSTPDVLRGIIDPGVDIASHWDDIPLSACRELAKILLAPDLIGTLTVCRRPKGHRGGQSFPVKKRINFAKRPVSAVPA